MHVNKTKFERNSSLDAASVLEFSSLESIFNLVPTDNPGVATGKILVSFHCLTTSCDKGHTVAQGSELGAIVTGNSNLTLEIAHKSLYLLEFTIEVDFYLGAVINPGNEVFQKTSHILAPPGLSKLAGMASQLGYVPRCLV